MKTTTFASLVLTTSLVAAEPPARQAAPQDRQAAPAQVEVEAEQIKRPIARCGVGEVDIQHGAAAVRGQRDPKDQLKAFPAAEKGMTRHVAILPKLEDEQSFKVEIIVGKTVEVDTANRHFFAGSIESENIKGWGYTRYVVPKLGPMAGTLRARVGGAQKEERFVQMAGEPFLIRYNSRLPVVVYVPEGAEVKFRVWSAGERTHEMEEG